MRQYYVYLLANRTKTIYTGVTNDLQRRIFEHKHLMAKGFAYKYKLTILVYYEVGRDIKVAISKKNGVMINDAKVIAADVEASNGVVHVINKVILPPSE